MDDNTEHSVLMARSALHQQAGIILRPNCPVCLNLMLLDRSGSMQVHGDTPLKAANECLAVLPTVPGAENALIAVFTFGSDVTLDVRPIPVKRVQPLASYRAEGCTKLYEAVYAALFVGLEFQATAKQAGTEAGVTISVITDGEDTASDSKYYAMMRRLAEDARAKGFTLQVVGIGIDSKHLAQLLGFDEGYAHTVEATSAGVHEATESTSSIFSASILHTMAGRGNPMPPRPPVSMRDPDSDSTPTPH